ncbi:Uncharacterised protein [Nocardia otitidiscaviarum]|uniref:Uncharacterized protein n=1 Tax=Nocardia otitidiscaviarum TaxID=1823 RepID=A0A379JM46_9NOCA|nr:hypothetical protein [Nocardia otitidiscaviarum]SUD49585.1 Uncharacterised protein [Nocardia otitidiscaviarum]
MTDQQDPLSAPQDTPPEADRLTALIAWLSEDGGVIGEAPVDLVWSWRTMPRGRALEVWIDLVDWVEWWRRDYRLTRVKGCWYRHRPVRHELLALMVAHRKAYRPGSRVDDWRDDLTAWHTQWMGPCLARVGEQMASCDVNACRYTDKPPAPLLHDDKGGLEQCIALDLADRPDIQIDQPAAGAEEAQPTMATDDMTRAYQAGLAEPVYPSDPDRALRYQGEVWEFDQNAGLYRRQQRR